MIRISCYKRVQLVQPNLYPNFKSKFSITPAHKITSFTIKFFIIYYNFLYLNCGASLIVTIFLKRSFKFQIINMRQMLKFFAYHAFHYRIFKELCELKFGIKVIVFLVWSREQWALMIGQRAVCRYVRTFGNSKQKCSSDGIIFRG